MPLPAMSCPEERAGDCYDGSRISAAERRESGLRVRVRRVRKDDGKNGKRPMRKPLRRSFTLWGGLFVLVFLIWVWADSFTTWSFGSIPRKGQYGPLRNSLRSGVIEMSWDDVPGQSYPKPQRFAAGRMPAWEKMDPWSKHHWWPERHVVHAVQTGSPAGAVPLYEHHLYYPYWMAVAVYLGLWTVLLILREAWLRRRVREPLHHTGLGEA